MRDEVFDIRRKTARLWCDSSRRRSLRSCDHVFNAVTKQQLRNALTWIWKDREKHGYLIDLWVRDKANGEIHRLGDDQHDGIWVSYDGTVHFSNLQNGDGCGAHSLTDELAGYEFCPSDYGRVDEEYLIAVKGETVFSPD